MPILLIWWLLTIFGILAVYSVSIHESFQLTLKLFASDPSNYFYFFRQLRNLIIWLVVAFIISKIPLRVIQQKKYWIIIAIFIIQLLVLTPLGITLNGSTGWLTVPFLWTIQPAELFKVGFVMFIAGRLIKKKSFLDTSTGFWAYLIVTGFCYLVFLYIRDLWTVLILGLTSLVMYRYAGGKKRFIAGFVVVWLMFVAVVGTRFDYIQQRLSYFLNPDDDKIGRGIWRQTKQSLIAIGGGGVLGRGYAKGLQKFGYVPEAQSDFIFAAFAEEIGFLGGSILLTLYFLLAYHFIVRLSSVSDPYLKLLGVGLISTIIIQSFINIGVNTNIVPLTGLTLPFVSFGGTALMVNFIELVFLYKIIVEWKRSSFD